MPKAGTIISVDEKYRIRVNGNTFTLEVLKKGGEIKRRNGLARVTKDKWITEGHHPKLQAALRKIIDMEAMGAAKEYKDLYSYMDVLDKLDRKYGCF